MLQPARLGVEAFGGVDEVKPNGWEWGGDAAVDVATLGLRRGLVWFHVVVPQGVRVRKGFSITVVNVGVLSCKLTVNYSCL